ncbi:glycerophosphodiester phosphodiesterase family protein [Filimonas effusa]|uniref:Glycerophosphodiester phosphodiesterase n=1 Tax=Filimonas effusa TaxID=2508721 RepID=A0A4Q1D7V8_9BACT|nr:glycerophosphodiester phosphodiesterase family protein [Filimonas effusa]RXK85387.1 glycerophosphodiester phosphodiesterase [Filimonas effusa]
MKTIMVMAAAISLSIGASAQQKVIKQGHRGCRGYLPENTIPAMRKALDMGSGVLELDVVISHDKKVVVSHDPYMSSGFMLKPNGDSISADEAKTLVLYGMDYNEIKKYDAGSKHNVLFPEQQNFRTYKPLLSEMIDSLDSYAREKKLPMPRYNIEIKSQPKTDKIEQPEPQEFVDLVMEVCKSRKILDRMNIQSFDVRPLQLLHKQQPGIKLAYLTANAKSLEENLNDLGFTPNYYSPYYKTVTENIVKLCHEQGMQIIPWTVNTKAEIDALIALKVDGIITDYPGLF